LPGGTSWLARFDRATLLRLLGRRTMELGLAGSFRYAQPPWWSDGAVHAVLAEGDAQAGLRAGAPIQVHLRAGESGLEQGCSRCPGGFGACSHVAVVAVDLVHTEALRRALLEGAGTAVAAQAAPEIRARASLEEGFDEGFLGWLAGTAAETPRLEIAATPFAANDPHVGRGYGDRLDPASMRILTVSVRRAGERRLLGSREIMAREGFGARDRRVLEYTRDRGSNRRAVYALGVEASATLEAMRRHGGVFAEGFQARLDFRSTPVRLVVTLGPAPSRVGPPLDELSAAWVPEASHEARRDGGAMPSSPLPIPVGAAVLLPGPFPFVWTREGAIYPVAPDVDPDLARQIERTPRLFVPPGKLREAGARLHRAARGRGVVVPPQERFGLVATESPQLVLRLEGEPLDLTGELVALYRSREIPLFPADGVGSEEGREIDEEAQARAHVERAGLVQRTEGADPDDAQITATDDAAVRFWREGLPAIRAASDPAIDVQLSPALANVRVGAPLKGRVNVVLEGAWLDTRLEFHSDNLPVELSAIRAAIARKRRWISLNDGTLAAISTSVAALADEAGAVMAGSEGRLPPHQLGRLDRWLEENDGRVDGSLGALRQRLRALVLAQAGGAKPSADAVIPAGLRAMLRPYQERGLAWLQFLHALGSGGILADDMGLGKTITTLAFLLQRKEADGLAPSLVVCPTSVAGNWIREAARFAPGLKATLLHGSSRRGAAALAGKFDLIVTTYGILRRDIDALSAVHFRCAVLDEAQNVKNADSATSRAARRLDASMRLALSGTPLENRLGELWSLASFANPGILGTERSFEVRFERPISADPQSPAAPILRSILRPFLLRRTKDEVLPELPPKTEIDRVATLGESERRMYDALAHTVRQSVARDFEKRNGLPWVSVFTALMRLRQMACDPRLVDRRLSHPGAEGAKRRAFLELVRELVAEGRRALVFSQFVELLSLWRLDLDAESIRYEYLDGSTTRRDEVISRFQEGTAPLFLISLKAGGAGLNLTAADTVIHCDPWWNPAVEDQATDRAHRIGQERPVTVVRLIAKGTIEDKVTSLKAKKRELTSRILEGDAGALEGLGEDDLRDLLADAPPEETDDDEDAATPKTPTDVLATADRIVDPEFEALAVEVNWWLASTGRVEPDLASLTDLPLPFAKKLAQGEPFPCSRAVADRIRARLRAW
jgi:superfamily II DNA or RNA helicase